LQCAVVLAKLTRFELEIEKRLEIGARYNRLIDQIEVPRIIQRDDRNSVFGQYSIICNDRLAIEKAFNEQNIPTSVHYPFPLNKQPAYRHLCCQECTPNSNKLSKSVLSLPMSADLTKEAQDKIISVLSNIV
jgi:UDP-2-acetamido-2-deoxy-ribo-hexuluronate aminotransferase